MLVVCCITNVTQSGKTRLIDYFKVSRNRGLYQFKIEEEGIGMN